MIEEEIPKSVWNEEETKYEIERSKEVQEGALIEAKKIIKGEINLAE